MQIHISYIFIHIYIYIYIFVYRHINLIYRLAKVIKLFILTAMG